MMEAEVSASVRELEHVARKFLETQRAQLRMRHDAVEKEMQRQKKRRRDAIKRQRRLFLQMQNASAPSGFANLSGDFSVTLMLGLERFETTLGLLRTAYPNSRLEILFSGRHLVGMLQRTNAYFFDLPCTNGRSTMIELLSGDADKEPHTGSHAHLWDYFCPPLTGREHLDFHLIDVDDCVTIPSTSCEEDRTRPIPRVDMMVASGTDSKEFQVSGQSELIHFAEEIAARSDAIFNSVAVRFSENLAYLERREAAIREENARIEKIERHFSKAEAAWEKELEVHREFRSHLETAILVNMGESGKKFLTTTRTLTTVKGSKLEEICVRARKTALREKTERRWNIETVTFPLESPVAIKSFEQMINHLRLSWPHSPPMPALHQDRLDLWRAAARFGVLTEAWLSWLDDLTSEEQWQLHYQDFTFSNSLMSTLDRTSLKKKVAVDTGRRK